MNAATAARPGRRGLGRGTRPRTRLLRRAASCTRAWARRRRERAKNTIAALEGYERIVANAAGCGSAMKDYGHVLRDDPDWAERADAFAAKVVRRVASC